MSKVIIFKNENGNVSVCYPTGEMQVDDVLKLHCPPGAIIVDISTLPTGADAEFFNAWVLNGSKISIDIEKAKEYYLNLFNSETLKITQKRQLNTLSGLKNTPDDATWLANLNSSRNAINLAKTTEELLGIEIPVNI